MTESRAETDVMGEGGDSDGLSAGRKILFAFVLLFILLVSVEVAGRVFYAVRKGGSRYLNQTYYQNRDWSTSYWQVYEQLRMRYEPYLGWRRKDVSDAGITIVDGVRRTVHPSTPSSDAIRVWCFGGSAMWGTGARDGGTIASHLAELAGEAGYDVAVRNFGESGWVSTQEVILLDQMLRLGDVPDVVLFYDGVNDTFSAFQSGVADGSHQNLDMFENYFELGYDARRSFWSQMATARLARSIGRRMSIGWEPPTADASSRESLASGVADVYLANVAWVKKRAEEYGFLSLFAWQPVVSWQEDFKETESDGYRHSIDPNMDAMLAFYDATTDKVADADVVVMRGCLGASPKEGYFVDHNHVTEEANAELAGCLFEHLEPLLQERMNRDGEAGGL